MHSPLLFLSWLRLLGQWRKTKRALASPMGVAMVVMFGGFAGMVLLPRLLASAAPGEVLQPVGKLIFHPAMLLALWLTSLIGSRLKSPIAFTMAEVDFLFSGPFTRRQLLVHKLLVSALGPLGLAVMAALGFPIAWWPAALVGVLLIATFIQWWTILLAVAWAWLGARYRMLLWSMVAAALGAAIGSVWQSGVLADDLDYQARLAALESSWAARVVLAPFVVFSRAIAARTASELLLWGSGSLAMLLAVGGAILRLDGYFIAASLEASRRRYAMLERLKRTGGASALPMRSRPRFRLPSFPRLAGGGPIAWRQALDVVRSSGGPWVVVAVPAVVGLGIAGAIVLFGENRVPPVAVMLPVTLVLGFAINMVPMGLRADLEHLETLKTLPIGSYPLVLGSVLFAILYETLWQLIAIVCMAAVLGAWIPAVPLCLAVAFPINVLTLSLDGVLVLLFPSIRKFNPSDPLVGIRIMLIGLVKVVFVGAAVLVAAAPLGLALLIGSEARWLAALAGYSILIAEGLAIAWLAAWLFDRFDASSYVADDA